MRQDTLNALRTNEIFDILIIGGGATGCGIAADAATRGLTVALVERNDFAEGTSSRSTKMIHGGVRYLEAAVRRLDKSQYNLVREGLHERGAFIRNAPHLTNRIPLVTPIYSWTEIPYVFTGLKLYDLLAGSENIGHSSLISRGEALRRFPALKADGLKAGVVYYDGQFVDTRMAMTLALTARRAGAAVANHVMATGLIRDAKGRVAGATVEDRLSKEGWTIRARTVINATGPYADAVCRMDDPDAMPILKVSSGIHIILDKRFVPPGSGMLIPKTDDGRVLFILPWQGHALIGTTDEPAAVTDHPRPEEEDIAYLLDHIRRYFNVAVTRADVRSVWCGIRPLVFDPKAKDTAQLARDHVIIESQSGLITISGGKWTTYRLMSEQAVNRAVAVGGLTKAGPCRTSTLTLFGGDNFRQDGEADLARKFGLDADIAHHLHRMYGDRAPDVAGLAKNVRLHPDHPYVEAEIIHAVRQEDAVHAADVLVRRTTLALVDRAAAIAAVARTVAVMGDELGWDDIRREQEERDTLSRLQEAI